MLKHVCSYLLDTFPDNNGMVKGKCKCGKTITMPFSFERAVELRAVACKNRTYAKIQENSIEKYVNNLNISFYKEIH